MRVTLRLGLCRVDGDGPLVICLLYTSDAADEEDSVDLGGCRIIKKKKIPSKIITLHLKCSQRIIP